jgi:hypothetical protein
MDPGPDPSEVRTEYTPQGVRFVFPPRAEAKGVGALVGTLVVLAGVSAPGVCLWSWVFTSAAEDRGLALALAILVTPLLPLLLAVLIVAAYGHSEIAIEGGQLIARERVGLLSSSRRRPLRRLSRLEVTTRTFWLGAHNGGQESRVRNQRELRYALRAYFGLYDSIVLAYGYPRDVLHTVAGALRQFAAGPGATAAPQPEEAATGRARIEIAIDQDVEPPRPGARYVRVSGDGNTLRFEFPPTGGVGCAILFGAIFAGIPGTAIVLSICSHGVPPPDGWLALVCPVLFSLFGLMVIVVSLLGRKRPNGSLEVTAGTIRASAPGFIKTHQWQWRRDELAAVRNVRDSDDGSWLQLDLADGRKVRPLASIPGLDWVAWRLRQEIQLPEVPP